MENIGFFVPPHQALLLAFTAILLWIVFKIADSYFLPLIQKTQPQAGLYWYRLQTVVWCLYVLLCFGLLFLANMLLTSIIAFFVVGIGWSFWTNLFAGILIRFTNQFKPGDHIAADFGSGEIKSIQSTYVELRNDKNELLMIPNLQLKNTVVKQLNIRQSPNTSKFSCPGHFTYEQVYLHAINCPYLTANQHISIEKSTDDSFEIRAMLIDESFKDKTKAYFEQLGFGQ